MSAIRKSKTHSINNNVNMLDMRVLQNRKYRYDSNCFKEIFIYFVFRYIESEGEKNLLKWKNVGIFCLYVWGRYEGRYYQKTIPPPPEKIPKHLVKR